MRILLVEHECFECGGGFDLLMIPDGMDVEVEKAAWQEWYRDWCAGKRYQQERRGFSVASRFNGQEPGTQIHNVRDPYQTFTQRLIERGATEGWPDESVLVRVSSP